MGTLQTRLSFNGPFLPALQGDRMARQTFPDRWQIGYCTNVHAGVDLASTLENLRRYALPVKQEVSPEQPMGIGLWLAKSTVDELLIDSAVDELAAWLDQVGLIPFTLNGFPYGNFHQTVVKHQVYEPAWMDPRRLQYTLDLIEIHDRLLPVGSVGSISTLPIGWGSPAPNKAQLAIAAGQLRQVAARLADLEASSGRWITLCLEPEPGCLLEVSSQLVRFFEDYLVAGEDAPIVRRYLGVCHDVCHAAVMFESQEETLRRYAQAGIRVGKVQISSSIAVDLDQLNSADRQAALTQLAQFAEDRYLHQTQVLRSGADKAQFYEDLPDALAAAPLDGQLRVHFHVPIYLKNFGHLATSRDAIQECLCAVSLHPELTHFEIETYAWNVLPAELRQPNLSTGIAQELAWFRSQCC